MDEQPAASDLDPVVTDEIVEVRVRRAPKFAVFIVLGIGIGVLAAAILTFAFDGTQQPAANGAVYSAGQVFGFLTLVFGAVGALLGGVVALIFDRTIGRKTRLIRVDRETVKAP